jgi:hypothetical protein
MTITGFARIVALGLMAYAGLVLVVESTLGLLQPEVGDTFIITTTNEEGISSDKVLAQNFSGGRLYASANHWPRAWYHDAVKNPKVKVTLDGVAADYVAVPVDAEQHKRVEAELRNGIGLKFLFGFAPQRFLRLDPAEDR